MLNLKLNKLITMRELRELIAQNVKLQCRYDLVGYAPDGCPRYTLHYIYVDQNGHKFERPLKSARGGETTRILSLWPGLVKHHEELGVGGDITFRRGYILSCGELRGRNDVPLGRQSNN